VTGVELYPAIDVRAGRVVRLRKGDFASETVYGDDPVATAAAFADQGARWIHVVDLDGARGGDPVNRPVIARIAAEVRGRARVQTGGGVRSVADGEALARAGVARVVMGSAAMRHPELVDDVAELVDVGVGLDHRGGEIAVDGWTGAAGVRLHDALGRFPAASVFVITDIDRDGVLAGPDVDGLTAAATATSVPIIASGGVADLDDVTTLARIQGITGVIAGRALYEGRFTVAQAIEAISATAGR